LKLPKGKTSCIWIRNVLLKPSKGQNTMYPGPKCPFVTVKRTKHAVSGSEMSFWTCQKDKTRFIRARNVFLKPSKGQNTLRLDPKCPFEAVKRTKHAASGSKMSFWTCQKDKTRYVWIRNVPLNLPKGQKKDRVWAQISFWTCQKDKRSRDWIKMSFWSCHTDKTKHYSDEGQFDGSLLSILKNMRQLIFILLLVRVHCSMGV